MDAPREHNRLLPIFLIVFVLVVASIAVFSLNLRSSPRTTTLTSISEQSFSYDYDKSLGLNLSISVEPIQSAQGVYVSIDASITNPSFFPILLQATNTSVKVSSGPCSQLPLGVGILQGNYGAGNFSQSSPMTIFYPGFFFCPALYNIDKFSFASRSENVTAFSLQQIGNSNVVASQLIWTQAAEIRTHARGSWTVTLGGCSPVSNCIYPGSFRSFSPGFYTALAQDEWGQVVLVHFKVTDTFAFPSCSSVQSNSTFIKHSIGILSPGPFSGSAYYIDKSNNGSIFLPLTNDANSPVNLTGVEDPIGHGLYNYQGNDFPPEASLTWYAVNPGELSQYPFSAPAGACSLLHLDLSGSVYVGTQLRLLFSGQGNETINLKD
jgi:hypothetical protein